jgi:AcrR family transcriptional regulator
MAELVTEGHPDGISVDAVASRAGVSQRTVFRHFETREALLAGFSSWVGRRLHPEGMPRTPSRPEDLTAIVHEMFPHFEANGALLRGISDIGLHRRFADRRRAERTAVTAAALTGVTRDLDPVDARRFLAAVHLLASSDAFFSMQDNWGLDGEEAAATAAWAIECLVDQARRTGRVGRAG